MKTPIFRALATGAVALATLCSAPTFAASYSPVVGTGATDYRTVYAPTSSYVLTDTAAREATLVTQAGNYGVKQWRIFAPPGAKRLYVSLTTYNTGQEARAAARFAAEPTSTYDMVTPTSVPGDYSKVLQRLQSGEELRFFSPGGSGVLTISQPDSSSTYKGAVGGWIYVNVLSLPNEMALNLQTRMVVDLDCYQSWYASATWDSAGNPAENATHTCSGSTGGNPGGGGSTGITGISISPASLTYGSNQSATISPLPTTATLPSCTTTSRLIAISGNRVTFAADAASPVADTQVRVNCGGHEAALTLKPASTTAAPVVTESVGADGNLSLKIVLTPETADLQKSGNLWAAARIPANAFFDSTDLWFFRVPSGWSTLNTPSPMDVAFAKSVTLSSGYELQLPIGFPKSILLPFGVEIHVGYQAETGAFKNLGKVWPTP